MARIAKRGVIPMGYSAVKMDMPIPVTPRAKIINAANKVAKAAVAAMFPFSTALNAALKVKKPKKLSGGW